MTIAIHIHCIVSRNDIVKFFLTKKHPMVLTDMIMLKQLYYG